MTPTDRDESSGHPFEEPWAKEIERRMADYRAGRVKTVSWEEVREHLHRRER
jgi:putative addiction module component (TIGR02574 family)